MTSPISSASSRTSSLDSSNLDSPAKQTNTKTLMDLFSSKMKETPLQINLLRLSAIIDASEEEKKHFAHHPPTLKRIAEIGASARAMLKKNSPPHPLKPEHASS